MSENVSRLKELLFEGESRTLAELQKRIDAVASQEVRTRAELAQELKRLAEAHPAEIKRLAEAITSDRTVLRRFAEMSERDRAELRRLLEQTGERQTETAHRLDGVLDRVGTPERLEQSVAGIIDGALRRAEVDRHSELAGAIAPLVVRTIKTEIRNSQDELAEALYPMTGRMVKAYVASAMKDLVEQINRRLEQNAFMLRLRSIMTGRPVAELALADSQRVEVRLDVEPVNDRGAVVLERNTPRPHARAGLEHALDDRPRLGANITDHDGVRAHLTRASLGLIEEVVKMGLGVASNGVDVRDLAITKRRSDRIEDRHRA
jgi:flagellar biosynthesis GTPase FlhF